MRLKTYAATLIDDFSRGPMDSGFGCVYVATDHSLAFVLEDMSNGAYDTKKKQRNAQIWVESVHDRYRLRGQEAILAKHVLRGAEPLRCIQWVYSESGLFRRGETVTFGFESISWECESSIIGKGRYLGLSKGENFPWIRFPRGERLSNLSRYQDFRPSRSEI